MMWPAFVALLLGVCVAWEEVYVLQPLDLAAEFPEGLDHKPAMFGTPSYASSISGAVVYATLGDLDGCDPLDNSNWPAGAIVMVDRGNCTFVTKVRNVQTSGGAAVIIVDNVEENLLPYMADDGTGEDVNIPSVLVTMDDGQLIKNALESTGYVTVQISWALPHPDGRVEWSLWTSANDPASREMKQSWGSIVNDLGDSALFAPHYFIYEGVLSGCTMESRPCGNQCTADGVYCAVDPDHDLNHGISGLDIVEENLRQMCLFDFLNNTAGEDPHKWWDYASLFIDQCCQPEDHVTGSCTPSSWSVECSHEVMASVNIDVSAVEDCVDTRAEELFDAEIQLRHDTGIFLYPTLVINNSPFRGSLACAEPINAYNCGPLEAICAGYASGTAPDVCYGDVHCEYGQRADCAGTCGGAAMMDSCGLCAVPGSVLYNLTCAGCDLVPNSGIVVDQCGVCGGDGTFDSCGRCWPADDSRRIDTEEGCADELSGDGDSGVFSNNMTMITTIVAGVALLIVFIACVWARRQQRHLAQIDNVLKNYLPLDEANSIAHAENALDSQMGIN